MALKQKIQIVQGTILQQNNNIEQLRMKCAKPMDKLSSTEGHLRVLARQQEEYTWEFQSIPLQEYIEMACDIINPPLYNGERGTIFQEDHVVNWMDQHELGIKQHQHNRLVPCTSIHVFNPSHGMDWREITSWYFIDGMTFRRILLAWVIAKHELLGAENDGGPRWYHNTKVPRLRWHQDLSKSIDGRIGRRCFWDPSILRNPFILQWHEGMVQPSGSYWIPVSMCICLYYGKIKIA